MRKIPGTLIDINCLVMYFQDLELFSGRLFISVSIKLMFGAFGFLGIEYFLTIGGENKLSFMHFTCISIIYCLITNHPKTS